MEREDYYMPSGLSESDVKRIVRKELSGVIEYPTYEELEKRKDEAEAKARTLSVNFEDAWIKGIPMADVMQLLNECNEKYRTEETKGFLDYFERQILYMYSIHYHEYEKEYGKVKYDYGEQSYVDIKEVIRKDGRPPIYVKGER